MIELRGPKKVQSLDTQKSRQFQTTETKYNDHGLE